MKTKVSLKYYSGFQVQYEIDLLNKFDKAIYYDLKKAFVCGKIKVWSESSL